MLMNVKLIYAPVVLFAPTSPEASTVNVHLALLVTPTKSAVWISTNVRQILVA